MVMADIESTGNVLLTTTYVNNKQKLTIVCGKCGDPYEQTYDRFSRGHRHQFCKESSHEPHNKRTKKTVIKTCIDCDELFEVSMRQKKNVTCGNYDCIVKRKTQAGRIGGRISATISVKRSKNEILFAQMCEKHFDILTNEPMFDGWDADVIIPNLKIAIHWNGIWHYKKVREKHNLEQVQRRDKIKASIIRKKGYLSFVIKDMGGFNPQKVQMEFKRFLDFVYFI